MSASDRSTDPLRCFSVLAAPEASVTPRVLGEFAKRGLLPSRFEAVHVDWLDDQAASHVAEVLRGMIHVERVLMTTKPLVQEVRA